MARSDTTMLLICMQLLLHPPAELIALGAEPGTAMRCVKEQARLLTWSNALLRARRASSPLCATIMSSRAKSIWAARALSCWLSSPQWRCDLFNSSKPCCLLAAVDCARSMRASAGRRAGLRQSSMALMCAGFLWKGSMRCGISCANPWLVWARKCPPALRMGEVRFIVPIFLPRRSMLRCCWRCWLGSDEVRLWLFSRVGERHMSCFVFAIDFARAGGRLADENMRPLRGPWTPEEER
mmetsp:Transcript_12539/g.18197  ORF Transcript_12539/g.18197 Transcript_12539/m.18197 type:complete len:239 (+) Transcript_12539:655-1371(+)